MKIDLGYATATGSDAVTQCNAFKAYIRNKLGRDPDGGWLHMVHEDQRCLMQAIEDGDAHWARQVREVAPEAWDWVQKDKPEPLTIVAHPELRIIARSRGA